MIDPETKHPAIRLRGVERWFGETRALAGVDLEVPTGALLTLLGPSGSGKTTALRLIAGFDRPDAGTIEVDGRQV
ncbi:MAG: ATP-binding cassette domain-containing protein, partial [Acidimicrobiia bacterium]